jgi:shikimate kinase
MIIFLIGFMGSGKSTLGKQLAAGLGYRFVDMDDYIERGYGMSVSEIFGREGEDTFRRLEQEALHRLCDTDATVVAAGGGTPCFFDNMQRMNAVGATVYIQMSPGGLYQRLTKARKKRPLVEGLTGEQLLAYITKTLEIREPFYSRALIVLKGENLRASEVKEALVSSGTLLL